MTDLDTHNTRSTEPLVAPHVHVFVDRCAGCQECVVRCPRGALDIESRSWTVVADDAICVGCRQCERTCPFGAISVDGPLVVAPRVERSPYRVEVLDDNLVETRPGFATWTDALSEANRCLTCPDPTCVRGCPVHNDIPGFIAALRDGDLDAAHRVLRQTSVLPDICSRVCDQAVQCEGACTWSLAGGTPVAIGALERFITDNAPIPPLAQTSHDGVGLDVAIVGSGPAGIAAAWELVEAGASVTVFEQDPEPGGLLHRGIPDFTLPRRISSRPWEALLEGGVTLRCKSAITPEMIDHLEHTYDAVVLANGAGVPLRLPIKGADLEGVWDATRFLQEAREAVASHGELATLRSCDDAMASHVPTVLVVGAGNTAMDVARLARRLGARAICVDWMDRRFAPVRPDELDEASDEGVEIRFSTTIDHLEGQSGRVAVAHLSRTRQEHRTKAPHVTERDRDQEPVDLVVMAMGYRIDPAFASSLPGTPISRRVSGLADRRWQASGILAGGRPAFARHQPVGELARGRERARVQASHSFGGRIWAAGDALVGPATVVEAMAQGREAAHAILDQHPSRVS